MIEFVLILLTLLNGCPPVSSTYNPLSEQLPDVAIGVGQDKLCPDGWDRVKTFKGVGNHHNYEAVLRSAWCQRSPLDHTPTYFVFIHKIGERDNLDNLAFRYDTTDFTMTRVPRLHWRNENAVTVTVPLDAISGIGRWRSTVHGICIAYDFPGKFALGATPRP